MKKTDDEFDDYELRVEFKQEKQVQTFIRSELEIAEVSKYRYFEVEVTANEHDSEIYFGLIATN
jgi:hypothetical protein